MKASISSSESSVCWTREQERQCGTLLAPQGPGSALPSTASLELEPERRAILGLSQKQESLQEGEWFLNNKESAGWRGICSLVYGKECLGLSLSSFPAESGTEPKAFNLAGFSPLPAKSPSSIHSTGFTFSLGAVQPCTKPVLQRRP